MKKEFTIKNFLNSSLLFIVLILILIFLSFSLFKELKKRKEKEREMIFKKKEIIRLEEENKKIDEMVSSQGIDILKEREARLKLGLKEPGEDVTIIIKQMEEKFIETSVEEKTKPNPVKWWKRFFQENI